VGALYVRDKDELGFTLMCCSGGGSKSWRQEGSEESPLYSQQSAVQGVAAAVRRRSIAATPSQRRLSDTHSGIIPVRWYELESQVERVVWFSTLSSSQRRSGEYSGCS
jgi:hypothetical protein